MSVLAVAVLCLLTLHGSHAACSDFVSASSITCQLLFDHLQATLLSRRLNLYNLRKTFLPLLEAQPSLVNVSYHITIAPTTEEPCPGSMSVLADTDEETVPVLLPHNTTTIERNYAWSRKTFYTIFHPAQINRLQPQLLHGILVGLEISASDLVALSWDGVGPVLTVQLRLDPVALPCLPTYTELFASLQDLTALLNIYASTQENITDWNIENLGHIKSGLVFAPQWYLYTARVYPYSDSLSPVNTVFATVLSLTFTIAIYYFIWKKIPSSPHKKNFALAHSLLWTTVVLLFQLDLLFLWGEIILLIKWCGASTCSDPAALSKIYLLSYIVMFNVIFFSVFLYNYLRGKLRPKQHLFPGVKPFITGLPLISIIAAILILVFRVFIRPCNRRYKCVRYGTIHVYETLHYFISCPRWTLWNGFKVLKFIVVFLPFSTIFTFLTISLFSVIPVILQALLYPFRILAAYSFFLASVMVFYLAIFLVNFIWTQKGIANSSVKLCFLLTLPTIAYIFVFVVNIPFASLYQLLSSGTLTNNPVTLAIVSIAPSLVLSSPIVWLLKNKILPVLTEEGEEEEEMEEEGDGGGGGESGERESVERGRRGEMELCERNGVTLGKRGAGRTGTNRRELPLRDGEGEREEGEEGEEGQGEREEGEEGQGEREEGEEGQGEREEGGSYVIVERGDDVIWNPSTLEERPSIENDTAM